MNLGYLFPIGIIIFTIVGWVTFAIESPPEGRKIHYGFFGYGGNDDPDIKNYMYNSFSRETQQVKLPARTMLRIKLGHFKNRSCHKYSLIHRPSEYDERYEYLRFLYKNGYLEIANGRLRSIKVNFWIEGTNCGDQYVKPSQIASYEKTLTRSQRLQIQRQLTNLGFNTYGIDGAFGAKSRQAIRSWQKAHSYPVNGKLTETQHRALMATSANPRPPQSATIGRTGRYFDSKGCLREKSGQVVPNFKQGC